MVNVTARRVAPLAWRRPFAPTRLSDDERRLPGPPELPSGARGGDRVAAGARDPCGSARRTAMVGDGSSGRPTTAIHRRRDDRTAVALGGGAAGGVEPPLWRSLYGASPVGPPRGGLGASTPAFDGRASRSEFWWGCARPGCSALGGTCCRRVDRRIAAATEASERVLALVPGGIVALGTSRSPCSSRASPSPYAASTTRATQGASVLVTFIPPAGPIIVLVLLATPSNPAGASSTVRPVLTVESSRVDGSEAAERARIGLSSWLRRPDSTSFPTVPWWRSASTASSRTRRPRSPIATPSRLSRSARPTASTSCATRPRT